jgi:hypothetical protein
MNIWFHYHISTPDVLGYVSSMAIENPHIPHSWRAFWSKSTLGTLERAKYLGDMRVRMGDVRSREKVGKTAFTADGNGVFLHETGKTVT